MTELLSPGPKMETYTILKLANEYHNIFIAAVSLINVNKNNKTPIMYSSSFYSVNPQGKVLSKHS